MREDIRQLLVSIFIFLFCFLFIGLPALYSLALFLGLSVLVLQTLYNVFVVTLLIELTNEVIQYIPIGSKIDFEDIFQ